VPELRRRFVYRIALVASAAMAGHFMFAGWIGAALARGAQQSFWRFAELLTLAAVGLAFLRVQPDRWSQFRKLMLVVAALFVVSQPLLTSAMVDEVVWPSPRRPAPPATQARTATIFLLLDELNSSSAAPLAQVLRDHGLLVREKAIRPVGDSTAKVIPAMFTGRNFEQARPCGTSAICSGVNVLDFSHVTASRDDIDVVGFFHPYCAIRSLRWCSHASAPLSLFDPVMWHCAFWTRTGLSSGTTADDCNIYYARGSRALLDQLVDALWQAPIWERGGFLYAHLLLPHPPAAVISNLQKDYGENLDRAVALLREMLTRARRGGIEDLRVVVFSDHPLRQAMWCRYYAPYARKGCVIVAALEDRMVPLIVAGHGLPDIEAIENNSQIFRLATEWNVNR